MPTVVLVGGSDGSSVTLNWITNDIVPSPKMYEVERLEEGLIGTTTTNGFTEQHVPDGSWTYVVTAIGHDDTVYPSNLLTVEVDTSTPPSPEVLVQAAGTTSVLSWNAVPSAINYEVACSGATCGSVTPQREEETLQFIHKPGADGTYHYQVRAQNEQGRWSPYSSPAKFVVDTGPPPAPKVSVLADGLQVQVSWTLSSGDPVKYYVRRNGVDLLETEATSILDVVEEKGSYSYRVRYIDTNGRYSLWSDVTENSTALVGHTDWDALTKGE